MDEPRADMAGEDVARAVTTAGHSLGKRRRGRRGLSLILVMVAGAGLLMRATPAAFSAPLSQAPTPAPGPTALPTLEQLQLQIQAAKLVLEGIGLQGKNDLQGALDRYNQALAIFRQAGDRKDEGHTLRQIGTVYDYRYDDTTALQFYQQALTIAREIADQPGEADALSSIGDAYTSLGQYVNALNAFEQGLPIARAAADRIAAAGDSLAVANVRETETLILARMAAVYQRQGQYPPALEIYQQALANARERGAVARQQGDALLQELYQIDEEAALNSLGNLYNDLGQYAKALDFHQQALASARTAGDSEVEATFLSNVATDYEALNQADQALVYYQQALALVRAARNRFGEEALLGNIGVAYRDLNQFDQALAYGEQALPIAREVKDRTGEATDLVLIGTAYVGLEQYDQALATYQQALGIERELGDRRREGITLGRIAQAYQQQGNLAQALAFDEQAIAAEEDLRASARLEELKSSLAAQSENLYPQTALVLLQLGRPADAFDLTERARARSFLDQLGNAPLDLSRGADPQLIQQEQDLSAQISALDRNLRQERGKPAAQQSADLVQSLSAQLSAKQQAYADLLTQLKLANPESASLVSVAPLRLGDVQGLLDANTTLVSYIVTKEKTLAFVVSQSGFQEVDLPVAPADLAAAVGDFRRFADVTNPAPPPSLQQLYAWLVAPLASQLNTPVVGIIPNGILNYLPFAALTDGVQSFGEQYTLFSLPSASVLPFIQAKRKGSDASVLAVAQSQVEGFPPLQYADAEAQSIAGLFGSAALTGAAASETAVKAQAGQSNILHLAAHGELNAASPLFSRILLGPDSQDDGSLTVQEVYSLNLAQTDLVVLSACETQLGGQNQGDDFVALNRAFIFAGSPTVIASLWAVNDQATSLLMTSFYGHLRAGLSKAQALQAAQADTRAQFPNPYYWAAFVLTGDPGS